MSDIYVGMGLRPHLANDLRIMADKAKMEGDPTGDLLHELLDAHEDLDGRDLDAMDEEAARCAEGECDGAKEAAEAAEEEGQGKLDDLKLSIDNAARRIDDIIEMVEAPATYEPSEVKAELLALQKRLENL